MRSFFDKKMTRIFVNSEEEISFLRIRIFTVLI